MSVIIRLQNLPLSANAADIRSFFAGLRIPSGSVHIVGGEDGDAFIGFATDEDARQAMALDHGRIHDQKVRLLLSSRAEMNAVIAKAQGHRDQPPPQAVTAPRTLSPATRFDTFPRGQHSSTPATTTASSQPSQTAYSGYTAPPRADYPSWPPQQQPQQQQQQQQAPGRTEQPSFGQATRPLGDTLNGRAPVANGGPSHPSYASYKQEAFPPASASYGNYEHQNSTEARGSESFRSIYDREGSGPTSNTQIHPPHHLGTRDEPNHNGRPDDSWKPQKNESERMWNLGHRIPGADTKSHAFVHQEAARANERRDGDRYYDKVVQQESTFQGYNGSVTSSVQSNYGAPRPSSYQQEPETVASQVMHHPQPPNLPLPPAPVNRELPPPNQPRASSASGNSFGAFNVSNFPPPSMSRPDFPGCDARYVELSRLPTELLRPASLEMFLRPSKALTLSSVKVVYDPNGLHMHSLVRFESATDAQQVLSRDGEQGIRIRPSTRAAFDEAVDGTPLVGLPPTLSIGETPLHPSSVHGFVRRSPERDRRERRDRDRSRDRDRRRDGPRDRPRGDRRRSRSRSPLRRRRRSPSPTFDKRLRRPPSTDAFGDDDAPDRFCLELTNLPYRVTDLEVMNFFSTRVPCQLITRSPYEDGQASDRWVAEFSDRTAAEAAYRCHSPIQGRPLKIRRISNREAERLVSIPDKFGESRKEEWERVHGPSVPTIPRSKRAQMGGRGPENFGAFSGPPPPMGRGGGRGGPAMRGMRGRGPLLRGGGMGPDEEMMHVGPGRGRGRGFPRGGRSSFDNFYNHRNGPPMGSGPMSGSEVFVIGCSIVSAQTRTEELLDWLGVPPSTVLNVHTMNEGTVFVELSSIDAMDIALRRSRQVLHGNMIAVQRVSKAELEAELAAKRMPEIDIDPDIANSLGPPGCVIMCKGFVKNIVLEDVKEFFGNYGLMDPDSIRIRIGEDGTATGECMLALSSPHEAQMAVANLDRRSFRGSIVTMFIANPL